MPYLAFLPGLGIHFLPGNKPSVNQDGDSGAIIKSIWVKEFQCRCHFNHLQGIYSVGSALTAKAVVQTLAMN